MVNSVYVLETADFAFVDNTWEKKDHFRTGRKFCSNLVYSRILLYGNGTEKCSDLEFFHAKVLFTTVRILVEMTFSTILAKLTLTRDKTRKKNLRIPFVTSFQYGRRRK